MTASVQRVSLSDSTCQQVVKDCQLLSVIVSGWSVSVSFFNLNTFNNMFEEPYPDLALEHLWLPGYGL